MSYSAWPRFICLSGYTAKSPGQVGEAVKLSPAAAWAWVLIPVSIFMADDMLLFGKGWTLFNAERVVPQNAVEVKVTGHQWFFEFDYGNGVTDQELVVEVGKPVVLRMTSEDVIHSFGLIQYKIKEDVVLGASPISGSCRMRRLRRMSTAWNIAEPAMRRWLQRSRHCQRQSSMHGHSKHKSASAGRIEIRKSNLGRYGEQVG